MQSSAEEGVPPAEAWVSEAALVAELSGMRIRALNARAEELGVPAHKLDEAEDKSDTKGALVSLIVDRMKEQESARLAQLRVELGALRIRALTKRAEGLGIDGAALDAAEGADDTKSAIIDLILRAEKGLTDVPAFIEPEPETGPEPEPQLASERELEPEPEREECRQSDSNPEVDNGEMMKPHPPHRPVDTSHPFRSCLDRVYVQKEIRWAKQYKKKIIIVFEKEHHRPGFFDYAKAADKYNGTEWEFILGIDAIPYQRDQFLADAMMNNILAKAVTADVPAAFEPINAPGVWEFFLSHHQALGGDQMKTLSLLFERNDKTVWYDNGKLDKSEKAMEEGVKHCKNFVLLLTAEIVTPVVVQSQNSESAPAEKHQPSSSTLPVFIAHRGTGTDATHAKLLQQHLPGASVGTVAEIPEAMRVVVALLSHDEASFDRIKTDKDPMQEALAAAFQREQVIIPVVNCEFKMDVLESLPDNIRSLARQLFVPVDWNAPSQGIETLRNCIGQVRQTDISPVLRNYLERVICETETFLDPCTQDRIHTETQCVPLKLLTISTLQDSRQHSTRQIDEADRLLMRRRLGLGGTVGYGDTHVPQSAQDVHEADVHFAEATAMQGATQAAAMMPASVILGPAACGKTTLLNRTTCGHAKDALRGCPGALVPYVIRVMAFSRWLINYRHEVDPDAELLLQYILQSQDHCGGRRKGLYEELHGLFDAGKLALIFDGIDEAGAKKDEISRYIARSLGDNYVGRMVISSRETLFDESLFSSPRFQMLQIQPLTPNMQDDVLHRRLPNVHDVEDFKEQQSSSENLQEMGTNPLLLALQIGVFLLDDKQLPERRTELYDKGVRLLLRRTENGESGARSAKATAAAIKPLAKKRKGKLDKRTEALMTVLCHTGHLLHVQNQTRDFAAGDVVAMLQDEAVDLGELGRDAAVEAWQDLMQDGRGILMCVEQDPDGEGDSMSDTWRSTHLTLQEYFAAKQCVLNARAADDLLANLETVFGVDPSPWLREVLLMVVEMLTQAEFKHLADYYLDNDDGSGAASVWVHQMLKCRREDTSNGIGEHIQRRLAQTRSTNVLAEALCHPSDALRTQGLTEITEFGMSKTDVAERLIALIDPDRERDVPWYMRLGGIQSLGKLSESTDNVCRSLVYVAVHTDAAEGLQKQAWRSLKTLRLENSAEVQAQVVKLLEHIESQPYAWYLIERLRITDDKVLQELWTQLGRTSDVRQYLIKCKPAWLADRFKDEVFDPASSVLQRFAALASLRQLHVELSLIEEMINNIVELEDKTVARTISTGLRKEFRQAFHNEASEVSAKIDAVWAKLDALDKKLGNQEAAVSVRSYESEFESQLQRDSGSADAIEPEVEPESTSEPTNEMDVMAELKPRSKYDVPSQNSVVLKRHQTEKKLQTAVELEPEPEPELEPQPGPGPETGLDPSEIVIKAAQSLSAAQSSDDRMESARTMGRALQQMVPGFARALSMLFEDEAFTESVSRSYADIAVALKTANRSSLRSLDQSVSCVVWAIHRALAIVVESGGTSLRATERSYRAYECVQSFEKLLRDESQSSTDQKFLHLLGAGSTDDSHTRGTHDLFESNFLQCLSKSRALQHFSYVPLLYYIRSASDPANDPTGEKCAEMRARLGDKLKDIGCIEANCLLKELKVGKFENDVPVWQGDIAMAFTHRSPQHSQEVAAIDDEFSDSDDEHFDMDDDARPSYSLKVVLVGPSMAGKSSLLNALRLREARPTYPEHGRTIGLDIERIELYDPRAGKHVVVFLAYDAGGHDEYQEMHQSFFSDHTLYILVWNVALSNDVEMQEAQAAWASLIQTCAPGSKVLLVASHADEVADVAVVERRCNEMTRAVHVLLDEHRQAQQAELDRLVATPSLDVDANGRKAQLEGILDKPLRLADDAVIVSSYTMVGVDTLRRRMLDEAFDKSQFPSFGQKIPSTYELVLRDLRRCHADQTSVSWPEMQESLSRRPDVDGQHFEVHLLKSQEVGNAEMSSRRLHAALDAAQSAQFESLREILLSGEPLPTSLLNSVPAPRDYGILHQLAYHGATDEYLFLVENGVEFDPELRTAKDGSTAAEIAQARNQPMFATVLIPVQYGLDETFLGISGTMSCQVDGQGAFIEDIRVELSEHGLLTIHKPTLEKQVLDLADSNATVKVPKVSKRPFCLQVTQSKLNQCVLDASTGLQFEKWRQALCRFASLEGNPFQLYTFSISLCGEQMSEFSIRYSAAEQIHSELAKQQRLDIKFPGKQFFGVDLALRKMELEDYYRQLFWRQDAAILFSQRMGLDLDELKAQRCRLSDKVGKDPDLIRRAIRYLRIAGEVIWPDYANKPALRERVFIFPQKLVDAMKQLVLHDLESQLDDIDDQTSDTVMLGREFCSTGVLHRGLLPWLWRNLHSVVRDEAQVDFMANLLAQLGLLTLVPGSETQRWLLPLRLPDRAHVLASASAHRQFAARLQELGTSADVATTTLPVALDAIARAGVLKAEELAAGLELAYRKADVLLRGRLLDDNGLSRDEIAAVHLYTQEKLEIYWHMNRALRMLQSDVVRAFWLYIILLQSALLKLPPAKAALYRGLCNPQPPVKQSDLNVQIADRSAWVWWAFTSVTTDKAAARMFLLSTGDRVLYTVTKGTARDVREYSAVPNESELLLPAGTAFITTDAQYASEDGTLLEVALEQTEARLLEAAGAGPEVDVHRHPKLAELAATLDHVRTDFVGRRYDFHQPLPAGLLAIVISRCATLCDERTSIWRRDLVTVMQTTHVQANPTLLAMKMRELAQCARSLQVNQEELDKADANKQRIAELIVAALQIEVTIKQQGATRIVVHARCLAGGHHLLLREKVRLFEKELATVVAEQWKGCSATVMCVLDDHRTVPVSECQQAAARGAFSVDVEGSTVQLSDLGFDEHDRGGMPPTSEGLPPLRTWELEPQPEPKSQPESG